MLNDEVCRAMTDKQTNKQTFILSKHWGNLFLPPSFFIFYFHFSNSLNIKKAVSNYLLLEEIIIIMIIIIIIIIITWCNDINCPLIGISWMFPVRINITFIFRHWKTVVCCWRTNMILNKSRSRATTILTMKPQNNTVKTVKQYT